MALKQTRKMKKRTRKRLQKGRGIMNIITLKKPRAWWRARQEMKKQIKKETNEKEKEYNMPLSKKIEKITQEIKVEKNEKNKKILQAVLNRFKDKLPRYNLNNAILTNYESRLKEQKYLDQMQERFLKEQIYEQRKREEERSKPQSRNEMMKEFWLEREKERQKKIKQQEEKTIRRERAKIIRTQNIRTNEEQEIINQVNTEIKQENEEKARKEIEDKYDKKLKIYESEKRLLESRIKDAYIERNPNSLENQSEIYITNKRTYKNYINYIYNNIDNNGTPNCNKEKDEIILKSCEAFLYYPYSTITCFNDVNYIEYIECIKNYIERITRYTQYIKDQIKSLDGYKICNDVEKEPKRKEEQRKQAEYENEHWIRFM